MFSYKIFFFILCVIITTTTDGYKMKTCGPDQYRCNDGRCIAKSWICDGTRDCIKGEDETDCRSLEPVCNSAIEFECVHISIAKEILESFTHIQACIPLQWVCDGEKDCPDGSDEMNCNVTCSSDMFTCEEFEDQPRLCIPRSWRCDGRIDCADRSDELNCTEVRCATSDFKCSDDTCISNTLLCDGKNDCSDGSDETLARCNIYKCDEKDKFKCATQNVCIPKEWVCDGDKDCIDHSDEANCTNIRPSEVPFVCRPEIEFPCKTGRHCFLKDWKCDGEVDCPDGSDEENCIFRNCTSEEFSCDIGKCIPLSKRCDGVVDCEDAKDEAHCITIPPRRLNCDLEREYECPGDILQCISYEDLCVEDKMHNDCAETICNKKIELCKGGEYCECRNTSQNGSICYCPKGFRTVKGNCLDINECDRVGICSQVCINLPGGYRCECYNKYSLFIQVSDNGTEISRECRAGGSDPSIIMVDQVYIGLYNLVTQTQKSLILGTKGAIGLDIVYRNKTVIWSDLIHKKIMICELNESSIISLEHCRQGINNTVLIDKDLEEPNGVAADWVHNLLFWTDSALGRVSVIDLISKKRKTLFSTNLDIPCDIAVDPMRGLIFWSDRGKNARIERSGMDGRHRKDVITGEHVRSPSAITVDILDHRLYWIDAKSKLIMSSDYWGTLKRIIIRSHSLLHFPVSTAVFENHLYWTDRGHEGLFSTNKFTGKNSTLLTRLIRPGAIRIFHELAQPLAPNKCENHDCEHLCLPVAHIGTSRALTYAFRSTPFTCACMDGFHVSEYDSRNCEKTGATDEITLEPISLNCTLDESISLQSSFPLGNLLLFVTISLMVSISISIYVYYRRPNHHSALSMENPSFSAASENELVFRCHTNEVIDEITIR